MRLLEVGIIVYEKKEADLCGEENAKDIPSKACIDLDRVCACWVNGDDEVIVSLISGDTILITDYKFNKFVDVWRGTAKEEVTPCVSCGIGRKVQTDGKVSCDTCGYTEGAL